MTTTVNQNNVVLFKDQAGDYFVVSGETILQGRVSDEQRALLDQQLPALTSREGDEVHGYIFPLIAWGFAAGVWTTFTSAMITAKAMGKLD